MAIDIIQSPMYRLLAAGQPIVFTLEDQVTVLAESNVKFIAEISGGRYQDTINGIWGPITVLKTTPNGQGVGMFDISTIIESYCRPSYQGREGTDDENPNKTSQFKGISYRHGRSHPLHVIDKFCTNKHNMFSFAIKFQIEYLNTTTGVIEVENGNFQNSAFYYFFNGVVSLTSPLLSYSPDPEHNHIGYNLQDINFDDGTGDYIIRGVSGSTEGGKFVTNMPTRQQIREDDYGTIAFFNCLNMPNAAGMQYAYPDIQTMPTVPNFHVPGIALSFWDEFGVLVQVNFYENRPSQGGAMEWTAMKDVSDNLIYFGHGLANMKGRNETWPSTAVSYCVYASDGAQSGAPSAGGGGGGEPGKRSGCIECGEPGPQDRYWKYGEEGNCVYLTEDDCYDANDKRCIRCLDPETGLPTGFWKWLNSGACIYVSEEDCTSAHGDDPGIFEYDAISRKYCFDIITDDCHGFESVRLTWLNRMGTWDYYTFTKKNTYKVKTKGVTYNQLSGTWNEKFYNPYDHLGGDKIFINKTKESWDLNTDYIPEESAEWFEELFTSPDVYILNSFSETEPYLYFSPGGSNYNKRYIEPVTVGSKSYTKKTRANDKLIKYKFKVDMTRPTNLQKA